MKDSPSKTPSRAARAAACLWMVGGMLLLVLPALFDPAGFSAATWSRHASSETLAALIGIGSSREFRWSAHLEPSFSQGRAQPPLAFALVVLITLRTLPSGLPVTASYAGVFDAVVAFVWGFFTNVTLVLAWDGQLSQHVLPFGLIILNSLLAISGAFSTEPQLRAGFVAAYLLAVAFVVAWVMLCTRQEERSTTRREATAQQTEGLALDLLSKRERDAFESLAAGNSQAATAITLGLSPSTVGTYRARGLKKLGLSSVPTPPLAELSQSLDSKVTDRAAIFRALLLCASLFAVALLLDALPDPVQQAAGFFVCELAALFGFALLVPKQFDEAAHKECGSRISHLAFPLFAALLVRESLICEPNLILSGAALTVCLAVLVLCLLKDKTIALPKAATCAPLTAPLFSSILLFRQFPGCAKFTVYAGPFPIVPELLRDALTLVFIAALAYLAVMRLIDEDDERPVGPQLDELRCMSYFIGRGLNQTQAQVALAIARGKSQPQISNDLHPARGTVNSARLIAYRKLAIANREQLVALLCRDTCPR